MLFKRISKFTFLALLFILTFSSCNSLPTSSSTPNTFTTASTPAALGARPTLDISMNPTPSVSTDILSYLEDIKEQTDREISSEQKQMFLDYVGRNPIKKSDPQSASEHVLIFEKIKKDLIKQWEEHSDQKWPVYSSNIVVKGKVVRKKGSNFDVRNLIELNYDGPMEWWNLLPVAYHDEHPDGIHRKDGPASKLFDDNND